MSLLSSGNKGVAPGTSITFDPKLIDKLTKEHKALLAIYSSISEALQANNLSEVNNLLRKFKALLQEHLLLEDVRLYTYLARHLADDAAKAQVVNNFRTEMTEIGWSVVDFLRRHSGQTISSDRIFQFREEFEKIGNVLVARIEHEEKSLYTLYLE